MKSPSPSKWRPSNAVKQLEADTIALAAGAVTAMLAANAAAAGPIDSPEKVGSSRELLMHPLSLHDLVMRCLSCIAKARGLLCSFDGLPMAAEPHQEQSSVNACHQLFPIWKAGVLLLI